MAEWRMSGRHLAFPFRIGTDGRTAAPAVARRARARRAAAAAADQPRRAPVPARVRRRAAPAGVRANDRRAAGVVKARDHASAVALARPPRRRSRCSRSRPSDATLTRRPALPRHRRPARMHADARFKRRRTLSHDARISRHAEASPSAPAICGSAQRHAARSSCTPGAGRPRRRSPGSDVEFRTCQSRSRRVPPAPIFRVRGGTPRARRQPAGQVQVTCGRRRRQRRRAAPARSSRSATTPTYTLDAGAARGRHRPVLRRAARSSSGPAASTTTARRTGPRRRRRRHGPAIDYLAKDYDSFRHVADDGDGAARAGLGSRPARPISTRC